MDETVSLNLSLFWWAGPYGMVASCCIFWLFRVIRRDHYKKVMENHFFAQHNKAARLMAYSYGHAKIREELIALQWEYQEKLPQNQAKDALFAFIVGLGWPFLGVVGLFLLARAGITWVFSKISPVPPVLAVQFPEPFSAEKNAAGADWVEETEKAKAVTCKSS